LHRRPSSNDERPASGPDQPQARTQILRPTCHLIALVFAWFVNPDPRPIYRRRYILLINDVRHPVAEVLDKASAGGAGNAAVFSPVLTTGAVLWVHGGATCDYPSTPNLLGRYDLRTRRTRRTRRVASHARLAAVAAEGSALFLLRCGTPPAGPDSTTSADIVRAVPGPFGPSQ
jgi:hypothetical protein